MFSHRTNYLRLTVKYPSYPQPCLQCQQRLGILPKIISTEIVNMLLISLRVPGNILNNQRGLYSCIQVVLLDHIFNQIIPYCFDLHCVSFVKRRYIIVTANSLDPYSENLISIHYSTLNVSYYTEYQFTFTEKSLYLTLHLQIKNTKCSKVVYT